MWTSPRVDEMYRNPLDLPLGGEKVLYAGGRAIADAGNQHGSQDMGQGGHTDSLPYFTIPAISSSFPISLVILPLKFRTTSIDRPEGSLDRDMVICTCLPQRGIGFAG